MINALKNDIYIYRKKYLKYKKKYLELKTQRGGALIEQNVNYAVQLITNGSGRIDNPADGHIDAAFQNVILRFGPTIHYVDQDYTLVHRISQELSRIFTIDGTQSGLWVPFIWRSLELSGNFTGFIPDAWKA